MQAPGLDMNFFAHQPLWLVVFQSYLPLHIFTGHNFDIDTMGKNCHGDIFLYYVIIC